MIHIFADSRNDAEHLGDMSGACPGIIELGHRFAAVWNRVNRFVEAPTSQSLPICLTLKF